MEENRPYTSYTILVVGNLKMTFMLSSADLSQPLHPLLENCQSTCPNKQIRPEFNLSFPSQNVILRQIEAECNKTCDEGPDNAFKFFYLQKLMIIR